MPTIKIKTDNYTPNFCALEAVSQWMLAAYHKDERKVFTVTSGRNLHVKELEVRKGMCLCSCSFMVTSADRKL